MTTTNNAPLPVRARVTPVIHEGANSRITRIGWAAMIVMSDGTTRVCDHSHTEKKGTPIRRCAQRIVDEANTAAGRNA